MPLSVEVEDSHVRKGEGRARRHPLTANGDLVDKFDDNITTLYDTFIMASTEYGIVTLSI